MILDVCCGPKHMWFDKNHPEVIYGDKRQGDFTYSSDESDFIIQNIILPDILYSFTALPFKDNSFHLIVFDPPHAVVLNDTKLPALYMKYGALFPGWEEQIKAGFDECFRVLKPNGTLIFKWNELDFTVNKIIHVLGHQPLFGHKSGKTSKTHWLTFYKKR